MTKKASNPPPPEGKRPAPPPAPPAPFSVRSEPANSVSLDREEIRFLLRAIREMSDPKTVKTTAKLIGIRTKLKIELRNQTNELVKPKATP